MENENRFERKEADKKRQLFWKWASILPALIMMCIIFSFSAKPGDESAKSSNPIAEAVVSVYESVEGEIEPQSRMEVLAAVDHVVRKTAHVTEYTILAIAMGWALWMHGLRRKKYLLLNLCFTIAYAGTDELHQLFVEGRSGRIIDVGIDSIGCLLGTLIFFAIATCYVKRREKRIAKRS